MSAFTPTTAERKKYADYDVEIRPARNNQVRVDVMDGEVIRVCTRAHRVPALKKFVVYVYIGADAADVTFIEKWSRSLPRGGWAKFADHWRRRKSKNGRWKYVLEVGRVAPDPFAQLELEMMIDATSEVSA
jgi:hypothetical protein